MIKHPALRVSSVRKIPTSVLDLLLTELERVFSFAPFYSLITDFQIVGSYARECAELHSDLDINIKFASEEDRLTARQMIKNNRQQFKKIVAPLWVARKKYGVMIDIAIQDYDAGIYNKSYYSLRTKTYHEGLKIRIDVDYETKAITERIRAQLRPPRLSVDVPDEENPDGRREYNPLTDTPDMYDRWFAELPKWRKILGADLQEFGNTIETAWMKP